MKSKLIAIVIVLGINLLLNPLRAQEAQKPSRLTIGGYGEAFYTRHFYSDNMYRYTHAASYADAKSHGRIDLPHVVVNLGYDFGKGWSMGTEIEFEHGGNEVAVEIEAEETGEFEHEIERGGEVALEQFWIQKSFGKGFNIRMGHIVVPVGQTNKAHMPTEFFTSVTVLHGKLAMMTSPIRLVSSPIATRACRVIPTRRFGLTATTSSTSFTWRTTSARVGAVPHRCGAGASLPSVPVPATVCTTAAPAPSLRQSCGMAMLRAMPDVPWRNSASWTRKIATPS